MDKQLYFHEEVLLLALRDKEGTIGFNSFWYQYAIAGGILAELLFGGFIKAEHDGDKTTVRVCHSRLVGEPVLDDCLKRIGQGPESRLLEGWLNGFIGTVSLEGRIAEGLCRRGVLRAEEGKILLIFSRKIYPELDPEPERALIERLRQAIFTDTRDLDPRTVVLAALIAGAHLLKNTFDKKELERRKDRIVQLNSGELISGQVEESTHDALIVAKTLAKLVAIRERHMMV